MTASTRRRVSGDTSARPLITFETVGTETPASAATSAIVAVPGRRLEEGVLEITTRTAYRNFQAKNRLVDAVRAAAGAPGHPEDPRPAGLTTIDRTVTVRVETDMEPYRNFRGI